MRKLTKTSLVFFLIATFVFIPFTTSALAGSPTADDNISAAAMTADIVVIRPLGVVSIVAGTAVFLVSLPFSAMGGNIKAASEKLVVDPVKFTFKRPLGDF